MQIYLTSEAKAKLQEEIENGYYMKVDIARTGCCGYSLTITAALRHPDDIFVEADGLPLAVSKKADEFLQHNVSIDYRRRGLRKGFEVRPA